MFYLFVDPDEIGDLNDWIMASEEANKDAVESLVKAELDKQNQDKKQMEEQNANL